MKGDKMKKLLLVLLVVALAAFLLVGCNPVTPPVEGEGEGEVEGVTVAIADSAKVGDYTYVSAGSHDITVTFPTPVAGLVSASISPCSGDYTKAFIAGGSSVVLFPDATRKIWTGSGTFTASASDCCASYVEVVSGECTDTVCIAFPVIVDGEPPEATVEVCLANCECDGCAINFSSTSTDPDCAESELCCGDDCSGLASWSINLYDAYPFDVCCDPTVCEEPIGTGSGIDCPIDFTTVCLTAGTYWAVISLVDNVGLEQNYYAKIVVSGGTANTSDCSIVVTEGFEAPAPYCITWATNPTATIGACIPMGPQPGDDKVTLTMAVNPSGGGTTSPAVGAHPGYAENQVVNINATPASGYHFVNWTGAVTGSVNPTTVTMDANKTVTANFELDAATYYTLTMAVNPSGGGTTSPAVGAHPGYAENQVVNINATPASGYHFVNWTGAVTGSVNPTTVTMDANKTVTANFELDAATYYTLTMAVNPSGGGTTSPAVGAHPGYTENQVVNITATPATGYHFVNWTGDVANLNSASTTVTMNANKTVTANFELDAETYALTMAVNPSGGGTTSPAVGAHPGYAANQVVNITATPATGYHFVNWTGAVTGSVNPTTVTMDANKTVTANFDLTDVNDGPDVVDLGSAGLVGSDFLILAKTAITATGATSITGDVGISPNKAGSITGFGLTMDSTNVFSTSSLMTGKVYAADYYPPTPANMTTAISAMEAAYTDAAGRTNPTSTELGDGNIGGMTLAPGLYKWSTDVIIPTDVTLSGDANDVWIFQIARDLSIASKGDVASGIKVLLTGGAQASNVFWQVGGPTGATLGTYSTFNGTILSAKQIIIETGAVLNGRAWAQSEVTLDSNTIVHP